MIEETSDKFFSFYISTDETYVKFDFDISTKMIDITLYIYVHLKNGIFSKIIKRLYQYKFF